ncbi:MAG TPA: TolC family protein, partial [Candidatus Dormibacteraeota bacterium]|nr:TolC family protein [Candidatus Dormibacteraeota bacterium]
MRWTLVVLAAGLAGCTAARNVWRPEGDGGWSAAQRRQAVSTLAPQAGVVDPLAAPTPPPSPTVYNLASALAEARGGNRPMQAEALRVGIARRRALEARGRLLFPTTTAEGRYTWYSDVRSTHVVLPPDPMMPITQSFDVAFSDSDAGTVNAQMVLPLDITGELRQLLAAAQAGYRGAAAQRWAVELEQDLA